MVVEAQERDYLNEKGEQQKITYIVGKGGD